MEIKLGLFEFMLLYVLLTACFVTLLSCFIGSYLFYHPPTKIDNYKILHKQQQILKMLISLLAYYWSQLSDSAYYWLLILSQ